MLGIFKLAPGPRGQIALAVGTAGWLVSKVMVFWGGSLSRHLPEDGFHLMAFAGAVLAGVLLADGFGKHGAKGWLLSALWFFLATIIGAGLGPMIGMFGAWIFTPYGAMMLLQGGVEVAGFWGSFTLGWLAVGDGLTTSLAVAATWIFSLIGVHLASRGVRSYLALT